MTDEEFFEKVDYEGGLLEAMVGYGLTHNDIDPQFPVLRAMVKKLESLLGPVRVIVSKIDAYEHSLDTKDEY
mgnify:CR=1 FL=1